jgi:hypothetical protein
MTNTNPGDLVIGELGGRIADLTIEATSWRVRALIAEARVKELEESESGEDTVG